MTSQLRQFIVIGAVALAVVVLSGVLFASCTVIPPGYVGIKVN